MGKPLACEQGGGQWLDRAKYFPRILSGTWFEGCPAVSRVGRPGDTGLSRAAGGSVLRPCQPTALPRLGVDRQTDGISDANKQPWPQAQRTRFFSYGWGSAATPEAK